MAPDSSTNVPQPTTLARTDVVVSPKDTGTGVVATQGRPNVPTFTTLPPQVRVPIVPSATQPITVAKERPTGHQETVVPHTAHVTVPAPVVRIAPISNLYNYLAHQLRM